MWETTRAIHRLGHLQTGVLCGSWDQSPAIEGRLYRHITPVTHLVTHSHTLHVRPPGRRHSVDTSTQPSPRRPARSCSVTAEGEALLRLRRRSLIAHRLPPVSNSPSNRKKREQRVRSEQSPLAGKAEACFHSMPPLPSREVCVCALGACGRKCRRGTEGPIKWPPVLCARTLLHNYQENKNQLK